MFETLPPKIQAELRPHLNLSRNHVEQEFPPAPSVPTSVVPVLATLLEKEGLVRYLDMDDPLRGARIRGLTMRQELLRATGRGLRPSDVAGLLGITTSGVTKKRTRNQILAVDLASGDRLYPQVQFSASGIIEGLDDVLAAFHPETEPWTRLNVLMGPVESHDAGNVFDLLRAGELDEAVNIAATWGSGS